MAILAGLFWAQGICAMPRSPWPPFPEQAPQYYKGFDEEYFAGQTNSELLIAGLGTLEESWSGYALQRMGDVIPFVVSALDPMGYTNVSCDTTGAFRFWINPYWSSDSVTNGNTPGTTTTVIELDAVNGTQSAVAWSLQISADGNTMSLFAQTGAGLQVVLQAPISWQAGASHNVVLDFGPQGSALFLDGTLAAQGSGLPSIPPSVGQLVIGSTLAGTSAAGADFDEFFSFNRFLTAFDVGFCFQMTSGEAALGPISAEEQPGWGQQRGGLAMNSIRSPGNVYDPDQDGGCPTGGPVYITNLVPSIDAYSNVVMSMDIQGGTNGVLYDLYTTTNLSGSPFPVGWIWICQVETCNTYVFSNQPPNVAFYVVEFPPITVTVGFGDNLEDECDIPSDLTNAIGVAGGPAYGLALLSTGAVIGWGVDSYYLGIPALTNAVSLSAQYWDCAALLSNGTVTNWGDYIDSIGAYHGVTSYPVPVSNLVAVTTALGYELGLLTNGTVTNWGLPGADGNWVPAGLTNVKAIASGWYFNSALLSNGVVTNWGDSYYNETTVPSDLTNVVAISAAGYNSMALRANGTVEEWGEPGGGATNVPAGLSNVVAISAGENGQSLALQANGTVVAWGITNASYIVPSYTIPLGLTGVKAIAACDDFGLAIESSPSPVFIENPTSQSVVMGGSVTLSSEAESIAGFQYQWELNGAPLIGQTNSTLTLTNVGATNNGIYQVVASNGSGSVTDEAVLTVILPPGIDYAYTSPETSGTIWYATSTDGLNADVTNAYHSPYQYYSQWQLNGTNIPGTQSTNGAISYNPTNDGTYTVVITNAVGSTHLTWNVLLASPGMVEAWGSDTNGECNRPAILTNVTGIAAGEYQSVAVTDSGTVVQWGQYWDGVDFYSVTNTNYVSLPPTSNVVAVAAGLTQALALMTDGTVRAWGLDGAYGTEVPSGLTGVKAIACGAQFNVALLTNGTVTSWGDDYFGQTNVPAGLSNVVAIAAGVQHTLALLSNGTVVAWGDGYEGDTNVPSGLTNVVAVAAGEDDSLALTSDGKVVAWGDNEYGQTNVPSGMSNVMAIAAGSAHSVALKNDGTLVAWGDNSLGQTNVPAELPTTVITTSGGLTPSLQTNTYPPVVVKLIAAGGDHTMATIFSPWVQYPVDVSKDLLLIYNTNSLDSSNVLQYYTNNRPMVANANVLGIGCTTAETTYPTNFTNDIEVPIQNWLALNPTKRPAYVILFQDIPSRADTFDVGKTNSNGISYNEEAGNRMPSVQYLLYTGCMTNWNPFITSINMNGTGGTNDCIGYINKLASIGSNSPGQLILSASAGYGNTNWYFDDAQTQYPYDPLGLAASESVKSDGVSSMAVIYTPVTNATHTTMATNVAGYLTWGIHGYLPATYAIDGTISFFSASSWYLIQTVESYNGQRNVANTGQGNFIEWFSVGAFGGTNYSNTPVGAVCNVNEPGLPGPNYSAIYFGLWASGKNAGICAWNAINSPSFQVVGDPLVTK